MCIESASNYTSRFEWFKNDEAAYRAAKRKDWFEECVSSFPIAPSQSRKSSKNRKWSFDLCLETANQFSTFSDWSKEYRGGQRAAIRNGWVEQIKDSFGAKRYQKWTFEACLKSAKEYETKAAWMKSNKSAYNAAINAGWLYECTAHMKGNVRWNYELCLASAKEYSRKSDWSKGESGAYNAAKRQGWFMDCTAHMSK